jgi:hypothetical protein
MRSSFRPGVGSSIRAIVISFFLSSVAVSAQTAKPEDVKFCDLIRDTAKYDGKLVKTTALYSRTIDADSLSNKDCQSTLKEQHTADAIMGRGVEHASRGAKDLSKLLKKGLTAEVTITGFVHAQHGQERGYYEVPLQVEIEEVNDVKVATLSR